MIKQLLARFSFLAVLLVGIGSLPDASAQTGEGCLFAIAQYGEQCFLAWGCPDGSSGFAYTASSLCGTYA